MLPKYGKICMFEITDKQFEMMDIFHGRKEIPKPSPVQQLELF
jgi:CRISPR-associated protein Cas2